MTIYPARTYSLQTFAPDADDCYAARVDALRIVHDGTDELPWQLDGVTYGVDGVDGISQAVWNFDSHADAVAAMPDFVEHLRCRGVDTPPHWA